MSAIEISETLEARLDNLARLNGKNRSALLEEALSCGFDEIEDVYTALHRSEHPSEKRWTLDELEQGLDLDSRV